LNGWIIQIGVITTINPIIRTTNNVNQTALLFTFELVVASDIGFIKI